MSIFLLIWNNLPEIPTENFKVVANILLFFVNGNKSCRHDVAVAPFAGILRSRVRQIWWPGIDWASVRLDFFPRAADAQIFVNKGIKS